MPIALLLWETVLDFRFGAHKLSPWVNLVEMEEKLIDRARSAFLVKWFGKALPLRSFYLKVAIENLGPLREQYLAAKASAEPEVSGLNLTEPLAGALGQIAGMALSPTGVILLTAAVVRKMKTWLAVLVSILGGIGALVAPGLGLGVGFGLVLPLGFLGGVFLGFVNQKDTGALIKLLGAAAALLDSTRIFLEQLLGPRAKVANPLLRQMLGVLDHVAGLAVQFVGFIAVVVVEIGPLLLPLALQLQPFKLLIKEVLDTLEFIWDDALEKFKKFLDPKFTLLQTIDIVVDVMGTMLSKVLDSIVNLLGDELAGIKDMYHDLVGSAEVVKVPLLPQPATGLHAFFETVAGWLDDAILKAPLVVNMDAAKVVFAMAIDDLKDKKPSKKSSPSTFPDFPAMKLTSPEEVEQSLIGPPSFGLGDVVGLGDWDIARQGGIFGSLPGLSPEALKELDRARHPVSVFALEKRDLERSLQKSSDEKKSIATVLNEQWESQQKLRSLLAGVVGRILPPDSRKSLAPYYAAIDHYIYDTDAAKKDKGKKEAQDLAQLPVRDIPDNGQLWPVVRRLTLHWPGGNKLSLVDFGDKLQKALDQPYPATAAAKA